MVSFYSHGKLLLTSEYAVLAGATALATPCKKGQFLDFTPEATVLLQWKSYDEKAKLWFEAEFETSSLKLLKSSDTEAAKRIEKILRVAKKENPSFLITVGLFTCRLEFNRKWGLGSSSTLISNIAQWAKVNPYYLLQVGFGGSGYDIACALAAGPILYTRKTEQPIVKSAAFFPSFNDQLHFIYLNQKKNSQEAVQAFDMNTINKEKIHKCNQLTYAISISKNIREFNLLVEEHERLIGEFIDQKPIKQRLFSDFPGGIKSLGAWGGDFILATGTKETMEYFKEKGYATVISFQDMVL